MPTTVVLQVLVVVGRSLTSVSRKGNGLTPCHRLGNLPTAELTLWNQGPRPCSQMEQSSPKAGTDTLGVWEPTTARATREAASGLYPSRCQRVQPDTRYVYMKAYQLNRYRRYSPEANTNKCINLMHHFIPDPEDLTS